MSESFADQYKSMDLDEDRENKHYLEELRTRFDTALLQEEWDYARDIIQDLMNQNFIEEAREWMSDLQTAMKVESDRMINEDRVAE